MKKTLALICAILMIATSVCSCGKGGKGDTTTGQHTNVSNIQNGVLYESIGQADENGTYIVPNEVTIIGEGAFSNDTSIKKVVIGKNVKQIAEGAFYGNSDIEEIIIADGVEIIGGGAFVGCTALKEIILPNSIRELGPYAFYYCTSLEKVRMSTSISEIYEYTFAKCSSLKEIEIPEGVKTIKTASFFDCSSLVSVVLPSTLETLGEASFANCTAISVFDLTKTSIKEIDENAFDSCTELKQIKLPETLESIGDQAFFGCDKLYDMNIPEKVSYIGAFALNFTPWYAEIDDDYKIVGDGILIKCNVSGEALDLSGKGIKHIGSSAFRSVGASEDDGYKYASSLSSLNIPEGVITIGNYAFAGCSLDSVTLPTTLESIGDEAFNSVLKNGDAGIDFAKLTKLAYIGENAFANCSAVTSANLASSVKKVGKYAFFKTGAMESFLEDARNSDTEKDDFWIVGDGILLLCLVKSEQESVEIPSGVKVIGGGALAGWDSATIYDSNEGITDKYWYNAWNMDKVKKVVLPDTVETICDGAFLSASSLSEVNIPDSVQYIGEEAFKYCKKLSEIQLGEGIKEIDNGAFSYSGLYTINMELLGIEKLGDELFVGCKSLVWVVFPAGLDNIGSNLLLNCTSLANVYASPNAAARIYDIIGNDLYSSTARRSFDLNYFNE